MSDLRAPFPWFGGKSRVAHIVWERFSPACLAGQQDLFGAMEGAA